MSAAKPLRTFFDSNVVVCAEDSRYPAKQKRAMELVVEHMRHRTGVVSLQVLQEFFVATTKKLKLDPAIARAKVELLAKFDVAQPSVNDILAAIDLHRLYGLSYWDSLVLRMAKQSGCSLLLSEDMQHDQTIDCVLIVNPFL